MNIRKFLSLLIILFYASVSILHAHSSSKIEVYVATNGNDANVGSKQKPFATIDRARLAVREYSKDKNIVVYIRSGRYYVDNPIVFDEFDSGKDGTPITYTAYPGEKPVIVGGKPLTNWERVSEGVYKTLLDIKDDNFFYIFENGMRVNEARYPNKGYLLGEDKKVKNDALDFSVKPADLANNFTLNKRSRIFLWPANDWFSAFVPIASVDRNIGIISLPDTMHLTGINRRSPRRYYLTGIKEAFDTRGEFYYDKNSRELFYRPLADDINKSEIIVPTTTSVVRFKGDKKPVKNIVFKGIDFTISRFGEFFCEIKKGTHGTNGWNEPANKEALVYFENAENCIVENSVISNAGYNGVSMVWRAKDNVIQNCEIKRCGFHAVLLSGYRAEFGSKAYHNKGNIINNNHLHDCGELVGHSAGVFIWASGDNKITNNEIHDMPRYGVCVKGQRWGGNYGEKAQLKIKTGEIVTRENHWDFIHSRNNYIAFNDIYRVSKESEDNGMISFWGSGKGNVVYYNKLHDIKDRDVEGLTMAVYIDDAADYITVENNIIYGLKAGAQIFPILAKGVHNKIINNYIICEEETKAAIRSVTMYNEQTGSHIYKRNIVYLKGKADIFSFGSLQSDKLDECDYNLIFSEKGIYYYVGGNRKIGIDDWKRAFNGRYGKNSVYADPLFYNVASHDFRLKNNSPALKMGIIPIDVDMIGRIK